MDVIFNCPHCQQELAVDSTGIGSEIQCPSCGHTITIPEADRPPQPAVNPIATSAAAKEERHFQVPQRETKAEALIEKPLATLETSAKEGVQIRIKTFKRSDCVEVGKDHFDEVVSKFLQKLGEESLVSITPVNYSHQDLASHDWITDYGVLIVYKG
jgi:predicted Zn finger-like uncharacterized protein